MKTTFKLKTTPTLLLSLILFTLIACHKEKSLILPESIVGCWVEISAKTDTIYFTSNTNSGMFSLRRGFEIRNGYRLPVIGSSIYSYEIIPDSIKVRDGLSSLWDERTYYFHYDEPNSKFEIGKFSEYINIDNTILTFSKIR